LERYKRYRKEKTGDFIVARDGTRLYYEYVEKSSDTIIFIHGLTDDCRSWGSYMDYYKDQGFSVCSFDICGHGRSEYRTGLKIQDIVEDLKEMVDRLDLNVYGIVSHSMGSLVATRYLRKYPGECKLCACIAPVFTKTYFKKHADTLMYAYIVLFYPWLSKRKNKVYYDVPIIDSKSDIDAYLASKILGAGYTSVDLYFDMKDTVEYKKDLKFVNDHMNLVFVFCENDDLTNSDIKTRELIKEMGSSMYTLKSRDHHILIYFDVLTQLINKHLLTFSKAGDLKKSVDYFPRMSQRHGYCMLKNDS